MNKHISRINKHYDVLTYDHLIIEYYAHTNFLNFGYWDQDTRDQKQACENLMERLLAFIPHKRGTILDVACGKGGTTHYLYNYYPSHEITAINISEKQLETARANAPGSTFFLIDATELEFENNSFDNIICVEAAFHFNTREKFLREAYRVLKPCGRLVLSDILLRRGAEGHRVTFSENNYMDSIKAYTALLTQLGFSEIKVIDVTKECWHGFFRNIVCFFHEKYLTKEIDQPALRNFLQRSYNLVSDLNKYVLVSALKQ